MFAYRLTHNHAPCDCGEIARYDVPIYVGTGANNWRKEHLYLCQSCYIAHLELELDRLRRPPLALHGETGSVVAVLRRHIRIEQMRDADPETRCRNIQEALAALATVERRETWGLPTRN